MVTHITTPNELFLGHLLAIFDDVLLLWLQTRSNGIEVYNLLHAKRAPSFESNSYSRFNAFQQSILLIEFSNKFL